MCKPCCATLSVFQSTPPRGWRLACRIGYFRCRLFQSTPPRGWRLDTVETIAPPILISIHSTTRVETVYNSRPISNSIFQSTPPRGWRRLLRLEQVLHLRFQSTPPRGWRHIAHAANQYIQSISIHSTTRVETTGKGAASFGVPDFNPLHHEGGDRSDGPTL